MNQFQTITKGQPTPIKGTLNHTLHLMAMAFDALTTGARTIPMGDNGKLYRELASRAAGDDTYTGNCCDIAGG